MRLTIVLILASSAAAALADGTDTRGPIRNASMQVELAPDGVQAPGYNYSPPAPVEWTAQWINSAGKGVPGVSAAMLRREIDLPEKPVRVTAATTAGRYILYVNGQLVGRGPADPGRDFRGGATHRFFYEVRDLTPFFQKGRNAIAILNLGSPGAIFQATIAGADGKETVLVSDTNWRGSAAAFLRNREFDANAEPAGWQQADFDDSNWPRCRTVAAPDEKLTLSELPPLMEAFVPMSGVVDVQGGVHLPARPFQDGQPVTLSADGAFSIHYPRVMSGRMGIAVDGVKGARITLAATETSKGDGRGWTVTLRDGLQYFEQPDYTAIGTIHVTVANVTRPIRILDVSADSTGQPVAYGGSFECSDPKLNETWRALRWATQINLQTHHLDSPTHQEPISDYGDYLVEDLSTYYAFGNNRWLARQDLRKWAWVMENLHYNTFHTSYRLFWLQALRNYVNYTGDKTLVHELAPYVHGLMDNFASYTGSNGILSNAPNYMFMDWVNIAGFPGHHPPAVIGQGYMTALFYQALDDAAWVCGLTGDKARADKYAAMRTRLGEAYNRELWDDAKGLYRDGRPFQNPNPPGQWMPADKDIETYTAQNNSMAVLYGLPPGDRKAAIMEKTLSQVPWNVRPYFMYFVFGAMDRAGLFDKYGVDWIHKTSTLNPDTWSFQEMGVSGDWSHGWISAPLVYLSSAVLGVTPGEPGFETVNIRPALCGLDYAKGVVPTPHGNIEVAWRHDAAGITAHVVTPRPAEVALPAGGIRDPEVSVNAVALSSDSTPAAKTSNIAAANSNARGIAFKGREGERLRFHVEAGAYDFKVTGK